MEKRDANWIRHLPCLWYDGTGEEYRTFRCRYMDAVSTLVRGNYNGQVYAFCQEKGIRYIGHVLEDENCHTRLGCGPSHYFRQQYYQDEAGIDVIAGQILPGKDRSRRMSAYLDVPYLEEMFERTAAETCELTPAMLRSLLIRYQGKSITLPAHTDVKDAVYGSLTVYQKEICEELLDWIENHGEAACKDIFDTVMQETGNKVEKEELQKAMQEILDKVKRIESERKNRHV